MEVFLVSVGMVLIGLYLVAVDTQLIVQTGGGRPALRLIGQLLAVFGGLCVLGSIIGG